jgi:hypothetical protein
VRCSIDLVCQFQPKLRSKMQKCSCLVAYEEQSRLSLASATRQPALLLAFLAPIFHDLFHGSVLGLESSSEPRIPSGTECLTAPFFLDFALTTKLLPLEDLIPGLEQGCQVALQDVIRNILLVQAITCTGASRTRSTARRSPPSRPSATSSSPPIVGQRTTQTRLPGRIVLTDSYPCVIQSS